MNDVAMIYLLFFGWLGLAGLVAYNAAAVGRDAKVWGVLGLLGGVISLFVLLVVLDDPCPPSAGKSGGGTARGLGKLLLIGLGLIVVVVIGVWVALALIAA